MKVAIIHDWLVVYGGAERVLKSISEMYPGADLFVTVCFLDRSHDLFGLFNEVNVSFIQKIPFSKRFYRSLLPLMPIAVEQFDLSGYDLIISSSHAVAKGVLVSPSQKHICYCHSPIRYAWDLQHQYLRESNLVSGFKSVIARLVLHYLRIWDCRTSYGVDKFLANSRFIKNRIKRVYGRDSVVVCPPVDLDSFPVVSQKEDYYFVVSRLVPYKKIPLIIEAFGKMPDKKLVVIGDGPDLNRCRSYGYANVDVMGYQTFDVVQEKMGSARAFVFAAEEDFGIVMVEALASGTPVIAYAKGGALDIVSNNMNERTGEFFYRQDVDAIVQAVEDFERGDRICPNVCRAAAERFSESVFKSSFQREVNSELSE